MLARARRQPPLPRPPSRPRKSGLISIPSKPCSAFWKPDAGQGFCLFRAGDSMEKLLILAGIRVDRKFAAETSHETYAPARVCLRPDFLDTPGVPRGGTSSAGAGPNVVAHFFLSHLAGHARSRRTKEPRTGCALGRSG